MSSEILPSTQPLSTTQAYNESDQDDDFSQNNSTIDENEILHSFPSSFVHLIEKKAKMNLDEINCLIEFTIKYLNSENSYPFNFFDEALSYTNNDDIEKAKDVLRFHLAINKLKLFNFFNPNESNFITLKIQNRLKESTKLITLITSSLNSSFNPTLLDIEYMPLYECLIDLDEGLFKTFFERCFYNHSFQNKKNDDISKFCKKGSALQGHGMSYSKRGLRNLANLILEQELRYNINIGPIGSLKGMNFKNFTCAAHGPFYLLVKDPINNVLLATKHLAYIVPEKIDKALLISIMDIAFFKDLISINQKNLNIARIFTMQEFLDLPEESLSSFQLEKYVQTKIVK